MKNWVAALGLIAAVFLGYYQSLSFGFVWDDNLYVVKNEAVHNWSRAAEAFTSPRTTWDANPQYNLSAWRPLRNISYLTDYSLFKLNPMGYHLHNLILHALGAVLLYFLLRRLCTLYVRETADSRYVNVCCLLAALFWEWHPVQTEVVAWVKSRDDLLATPLFFAALLLALPATRERRGPGSVALAFAVLLYMAALLSKENTVVLAAILPVMLFGKAWRWFGPRPFEDDSDTDVETEWAAVLRGRLRYAFWISFVLGLITIAALALRDIVLGRTAQATYPGTFSETMLTMASAFAKYIQLILWPWPPTVQSADYDGYAVISSWLHPGALAGFAILVALLVTADAARRRAPLVSIGILFFLIGMIPYANLIPMMQIMAERFLYLPLAGIAMVLAGALVEIEGGRMRTAGLWIAGTLALALVIQTQFRLPVWSSEVALFDSTRRANPTSWRPADLYTKSLLKSGETTAALEIARENLQRWPNDPDIVRTAAVTYLLAGHEAGGAALTRRAVQLQPDDYRASQTLQQWQLIKQQQSP